MRREIIEWVTPDEGLPDKFKFCLVVDASLPDAVPSTACFMGDSFAVQGQVYNMTINRVLKWAYMPRGKDSK